MSKADLQRAGKGIFGEYEKWLAIGILTLALVIFIWQTWTHWVVAYYGLADEHGYMTTAKRLALTGQFAQRQTDPYAFIGETMMQSPKDPTLYYLRQPIGYPLLAAAAYWLGGADTPFAVNPLLGIFLLVGIYVVGMQMGSRVGGAVAALVIGTSGLVLYYTVAPLSHMLDMTLAVWSIVAGLAWRREGKWWQAAACGLLVGMAVLTRYVSVLLLLPLGLLVAEKVKSSKFKSWKVWAHVGIAGAALLAAIVPLLAYHAVAYGGIFRTGYSAGENATSFSWGWFVAHAPAMAGIVAGPEFGLTAVLLSAVMGIGVLVWKRRGVEAALLLLWALPPLIVYTAYYGMPAKNMLLYARFALPSFVPLALLGTVWVGAIGKRWAYGVVLAAAVVTVCWNSFFNPAMAAETENNQNYRLYSVAVGLTLHDNVPPGSVVICDNFTHYFADYTGDYIIYDPAIFFGDTLNKRLSDLKHTPHEFDPARTRQLAQLLGGLTDAQRLEILREQLLKYALQGKKIYLVSSDLHTDFWQKALEMKLTLVDRSMYGTLDLFEIQVQ